MRISTAIRCFFLFCIASTLLSAQDVKQEPRFALEVQSGDGDQPMYDLVTRAQENVRSTAFVFRQKWAPLPGKEVAAGDEKKVCALGLEYKEDGDAVSINASLYLGDCSDTSAWSRSAESHPSQPLGNYLVRLDETIVLEEMKQFGLQPFTIKVVNAQLPHPDAPAVSKVPSLQISVVSEDRQFFHLVIRNMSAQAVTSLVVKRSTPDGASSATTEYPVIAPGGAHEVSFGGGALSCPPPDSAAAEDVPCPIVLEAALFADGTYGGDPEAAANLEAGPLAAKMRRQQLRDLIRNTVYDSALSDDAKIAQLRSEIAKLPEELDQASMDQIQSRYPNLSDAARNRIRVSMRGSCAMENQMALDRLKQFEDSSSKQSGNAKSLAQWLSDTGMAN